MGSEWKRPENVPFPSIWRKFEGRKLINGAPRKYWVQDITDDLFKPALELMSTLFLQEEALCKYNKVLEDPEAVEEMKDIWTSYAQHKLGIICLTKNEAGENEIVGINMTARSYKGEELDKLTFKSDKLKNLFGVIMYVYKQVDIYEKFNIDQELTALGLFVHPKYRGEGVGVEILKSRRELCLAIGFKASFTLFTSNTSQAVARKAGFQDVVNVSYEELAKVNPLFVPPGIQEVSNSQRYMYILYE